VALARERRSRLEILALVPRHESLLMTFGRAFVPLRCPTAAEIDSELRGKLTRLVGAVPQDVPVRYRVVRRWRRAA